MSESAGRTDVGGDELLVASALSSVPSSSPSRLSKALEQKLFFSPIFFSSDSPSRTLPTTPLSPDPYSFSPRYAKSISKRIPRFVSVTFIALLPSHLLVKIGSDCRHICLFSIHQQLCLNPRVTSKKESRLLAARRTV